MRLQAGTLRGFRYRPVTVSYALTADANNMAWRPELEGQRDLNRSRPSSACCSAIPVPLRFVESIQIFRRDVVFRNLLRMHFALVRFGRVFYSPNRFGLKILAFFQQFLNTLGIGSGGAVQSLQVAGLSRGRFASWSAPAAHGSMLLDQFA